MIVLDTNVISELWRVVPDPAVRAWIDAQVVETLYLSAVTVAELRLGIAVMSAGKRQRTYRDRLEREVLPAFAGRVLPFDLDAARHYADFMAQAQTAGRAIVQADGHIAAIAAARGFIVASRDTSPFEAAGVRVVDPWKAEA
ncbi:type II toxin-antitoxin system VapC family toxin [Methylobacterium organophilum]|uniref:Ribonuclease VapC n=1 Tax=Methylobacterium organophilum TaxID=410 RepID=A0ABQ4T7N2_METOR|nr:type II toxin-antitoxin system VapC family toxin [Methylobacterium organophilum]GJE26900.1 Toxin FitB [Methylobacterium organophilum]